MSWQVMGYDSSQRIDGASEGRCRCVCLGFLDFIQMRSGKKFQRYRDGELVVAL